MGLMESLAGSMLSKVAYDQVIGAQSQVLSGKHGKKSLITGAGREEERVGCVTTTKSLKL